MTIWSKLDRTDKMAFLTGMATIVIWYFYKGRKVLS